MSEADPVAYLRARHSRAEQLARACPPGQSLLPEPAEVLARVTAERAIIALHKLVKKSGYDGYGLAVVDACPICSPGAVCYAPGPCRTVRLLAAGWGWTEET